MCGPTGGILNDPILLRVAEDEWWFSLADSDMNFYLQGINHDGRWNCEIAEIDVAPVQIQGPKAPALMDELCGPHMSKLKYYDCIPEKINGCDVMVTVSGFSTELGYEIYLRDATKNAEKLWNHVLDVGEKHHLKVIAPGHHRRIEAGLMSYNQDIDWEVTPYQCGLGWQVNLKREDDFVGKKALKNIKENNLTTHKLAGLRINADGNSRPIEWYNSDFYHVFDLDTMDLIGYVTSAWYSPAQGCNIAMAMLPNKYTEIGANVGVALPNRYKENDVDPAEVCVTPFKQPPKGNEGTGLRLTGSKL